MHPHATTSSSLPPPPRAVAIVVAGGMPLQVNVLKSNSRSFRVEIALQMQSKKEGWRLCEKFTPVVAASHAVCANFFVATQFLLPVAAVATQKQSSSSSIAETSAC